MEDCVCSKALPHTALVSNREAECVLCVLEHVFYVSGEGGAEGFARYSGCSCVFEFGQGREIMMFWVETLFSQILPFGIDLNLSLNHNLSESS